MSCLVPQLKAIVAILVAHQEIASKKAIWTQLYLTPKYSINCQPLFYIATVVFKKEHYNINAIEINSWDSDKVRYKYLIQKKLRHRPLVMKKSQGLLLLDSELSMRT